MFVDEAPLQAAGTRCSVVAPSSSKPSTPSRSTGPIGFVAIEQARRAYATALAA